MASKIRASSLDHHYIQERLAVQVARSFSTRKWLALHAYIPVGILHFEALLCVDSFDRKQCLHFKYWEFDVSGERFLLSWDKRDECLSSVPDEFSGYIISGHDLPPRQRFPIVPDENEGVVYATEYSIPPSTKQNLNNLNPDFSEHISCLKVECNRRNPQTWFSKFAWGYSFVCR